MRNTFTSALPHLCDHKGCDRAFGSSHGLNVHKYRAHIKNWTPTPKGSIKVGNKFKQPDPLPIPPLKEYSQTQCPVCQREYRNRPNLSHHIRHVHGKSIMDFPHLMVGKRYRKRHNKRRKGYRLSGGISFPRPNKEKPAPVRGYVDYCPRCGQNIKAFELAAGFLT